MPKSKPKAEAAALAAFRRWYTWEIDMDGPGPAEEDEFLWRLRDELRAEIRPLPVKPRKARRKA